MIPTRPKELIEGFTQTEKYKDMNPDELELIVTETYKELRRQMETLDHAYIRLPIIGMWFIKVWTLIRQREWARKRLENRKPNMMQITIDKWTDVYERLARVYERVTADHFKRREYNRKR